MLSHRKDWKKFESTNKSIALNILFVPYNREEWWHACKSKQNLNRKNQVILLMNTDNENWHYLAVKHLNALLCKITSNRIGDFYYLNFFHWYSTEDKLKRHYSVCKNNDYCYTEISKEDNKTLKYNHGEKSMKAPFVIYADMESLLKSENLS